MAHTRFRLNRPDQRETSQRAQQSGPGHAQAALQLIGSPRAHIQSAKYRDTIFAQRMLLQMRRSAVRQALFQILGRQHVLQGLFWATLGVFPQRSF